VGTAFALEKVCSRRHLPRLLPAFANTTSWHSFCAQKPPTCATQLVGTAFAPKAACLASDFYPQSPQNFVNQKHLTGRCFCGKLVEC
ncbi:MAG: hypothetical protein RSE98_00755, partial [Anaerovoracaceae bacterium]